MSLESLARLFAHMAWADDEVGRALTLAAKLPDDALELYAHVVGAELIWIDRIERVEQSVAVWPQVTLEAALELARRSRQRYANLLDRIQPADLAELVAYVNSAGAAFETTLEDILLHVALHGAYHRGQVSRALREAGYEPAPTDYIGFARGAPAATRADSG